MPHYKVQGYDRQTQNPETRVVEADDKEAAATRSGLIVESVLKMRPPKVKASKPTPAAVTGSYPMMLVLGWILRVAAGIFALVGLYMLATTFTAATSSDQVTAVAGSIGVVISLLPIAAGLVIGAAGEILFALRAIAINSARS